MEPNPLKKPPSCPRCGNRLRLRADQLGEQIRCPKCNATFFVAKPGTLRAAAVSDTGDDDSAYEPEIPLRPSSVVRPEEMVDLSPSANQQAGYEWDGEGELEMEAHHQRPQEHEPDYLALAEAKGLLRPRETIVAPQSLFFSDVFAYPWFGSNTPRWVVMSLGLSLVFGTLLATAARMADGLGTGTLLIPILALVSTGAVVVVGAYCAPCLLAAIQSTVDGQDEISDETMPTWEGWILLEFCLDYVWILSGSFGIPLSMVLMKVSPDWGMVAVPISVLVFFPIFLLSALECDSFLFPFSPVIWLSLWHHTRTWIAFYLVSSGMLVVTVLLASFAIQWSPIVVGVLMGPVAAALILIYGRLMGRLAGKISGMYDERQSSSDHDSDFVRGQKARGKRRQPVPEDLRMPDE